MRRFTTYRVRKCDGGAQITRELNIFCSCHSIGSYHPISCCKNNNSHHMSKGYQFKLVLVQTGTGLNWYQSKLVLAQTSSRLAWYWLKLVLVQAGASLVWHSTKLLLTQTATSLNLHWLKERRKNNIFKQMIFLFLKIFEHNSQALLQGGSC